MKYYSIVADKGDIDMHILYTPLNKLYLVRMKDYKLHTLSNMSFYVDFEVIKDGEWKLDRCHIMFLLNRGLRPANKKLIEDFDKLILAVKLSK